VIGLGLWWWLGILVALLVVGLVLIVLGLCYVAGEADRASERFHRELGL
jgi:hypothetical protein